MGSLGSGCDSPLSIRYDPPRPDGKGGFIYWFPADCGKCLNCLNKRKRQWSYRMAEEQKNAYSSYFVTLTYEDNHITYGDNGYTANKNDHMLFIKWLKYYEGKKALDRRKEISMEELDRRRRGIKEDKKLLYFGVIEYGDKKGRPHMHYILFNVRDINNINLAWSEQVRIAKGLYKPGSQKGIVQVDECNINTIDYTLKYMLKHPGEMDRKDKQREKAFMSKGLGLNAVDDEMLKYIKRPDGNSLINQRGGRLAVPRYYSKKFLTDEEREEKRKFVEVKLDQERVKKELDIVNSGAVVADVELSGKKAREAILKNRIRREVD